MEKSSTQAESCHGTTLSPICLLVTPRALQFFFCIGTLILLAPLRGALSVGATYPLSFVDIDGNKHSTADGHLTVIVLTTPADREKARTVGDRVPEYCLGNPDYRMITVIRFARRHTVVGRKIATAFIRHQVNQEAKRLQTRYDEKKIVREARKDIFVATDFDGSISSQLGEPEGATDFRVFVFGRNGELIALWRGVPSADQLAVALK
ncbi:MAG TPA: hypothetical protein VFA61_03975 [Candidatus Udaeobacter sp.]|nr:hypothetical protein [Candidatus Udaeobacter sp.]